MAAVGGSYRSVLAIRDFRLLVVGATASQIGDWLYNVALLVYVYDRTHSATWVGAATIVRLLPLVLLGPLGGVVADRFDRIRVIITAASIQWALMATITIVVARTGPALAVILLAGANTAASTPSRPAQLATLPTVVGEAGLAPGNALLHTVQDVGTIAGPALGALILVVGSPAAAFGFNALSFLVAAVTFCGLRVRCPGLGPEQLAGPLRLFVDGMRAVRTTPGVAVLTFLTFIGAFTYGAQTVQLVVYVQSRLGLSSDGYGYLLAAFGAGGVLGATVSGRLAARPRMAVPVIIAGLVFVSSQLLFAATSLTAVALAIGVVSGLGMVVSDVVSETAITRAAPGELIGRIFASYDGVCVGGMVLGALVAAPLVRSLGIRPSLVVLGLAAVAATLVCLPLLLRLDARTAGRVEALAPTVRVLSALPIFTGATAAALERLAAAATELRVGSGMVVIRQGDPADAFYVCTSGTLEVTARREGARVQTKLRDLDAPAYFGEIGLVERIPRTASVRATSDCTLLRIDGELFLEALTEAPSGTIALAEGVRGGLARTHPSVRARHAEEMLAKVG